jgi:hypothetical protein
MRQSSPRRVFTSLEHHYHIHINTIPPTVDEQQRQLQITELVEEALTFTLPDLQR